MIIKKLSPKANFYNSNEGLENHQQIMKIPKEIVRLIYMKFSYLFCNAILFLLNKIANMNTTNTKNAIKNP